MPGPSAFAVLDPKGLIALSERSLLFHAVEYMLIVAIPVYVLLFFFAYKYRASNTKATYAPKWEHSKLEELVWWAIPFEIVLVLGALTWGSTHQLDPRKPLTSAAPMVIEVVALDSKWLFIYPEQQIATINYLRIPIDRPIEFDVTSNGPMNSFWIPQLGDQIYAMTGMVNTLNLIASHTGIFAGSSANYSGEGFAQMKFQTEAVPEQEFASWVTGLKNTSGSLTLSEFDILAVSGAIKPGYYSDVESELYDKILKRFKDPNIAETHSHH